MKRVVILTSTRAEYGLLKPLMNRMIEDEFFDVRIAVTGTHLSKEHGMTVSEIESDNMPIDTRIDILSGGDTPVALSKTMGTATTRFAEYFDTCNPDGLVVLGDRYETLAVCVAAMNARIPIFHLHGGEATEGLIDEAIRHCITKMSYLHFTSTEAYRKRVIQMGESPERVFNTGAIGIENIRRVELLNQKELEDSLGFSIGEKYAIGTFHPVTLEHHTAEQQIKELLKAVDSRKDLKFIFTKANADTDGRIINELLDSYNSKSDRFFLVDSLGMRRYLSALKHAQFVIGNSSSGLIEAPSFHIPTIDIGDRQKGRIAGESVIHCEPSADEIQAAISQAMNSSFREKLAFIESPYGDGNTSEKIADVLKEFYANDKIHIKKRFYDIEFEV